MDTSKLSPNALDIFLMAENTREIKDKVSQLINTLKKKQQKNVTLSVNILAISSWMERICSASVKKCRIAGNKKIKTADRKEFKQAYAQYLIETL